MALCPSAVFCANCLIWCSQHKKGLLHGALWWTGVCVQLLAETFPAALVWGGWSAGKWSSGERRHLSIHTMLTSGSVLWKGWEDL